MKHASVSPFDSIESAHDFIGLFAEAVADAKRDIESDIQREEAANGSRRLDAFRLAAYNVEKLEQHLNKSRRILNDLRSLRRLLFAERAAARVSGSLKPAPINVRQPDVPPPTPAQLSAAPISPVGNPADRAGIVA